MSFRLSVETKYKLVFYSITFPVTILVIALVLVALCNPIRRHVFMDWVESFIYTLADWRDSIPVIKYHREKAGLFDMLRNLGEE